MAHRARGPEIQQRVIDEFRANAGRVGGYFTYMPLLLLTTVGARTGLERTTPLAFLGDGDRYIVVAANAGAPRHPDWYHNLLVHPEVRVELGDEAFEATAVVAAGKERDALFDRFVADSPQLGLYQAGTTREIPVVVLTRRRPAAP